MSSNINNPQIQESSFKDWMRRLKKGDGDSYISRTVDRYARALRLYIADPLFAAVDVSNLFDIETLSQMVAIDENIRNTDGFKDFDQSHGHGDLSAALVLYLQFLKACDHDNDEFSIHIDQDAVKRLATNFRSVFPEFSTFVDAGGAYRSNEDAYKRAAVAKMSENFREWTEQTPDSLNNAEFKNRILLIFKATNLVDFRTNIFVKESILTPENISEFKSLAHALVGQAFEGNIEQPTFDAFAAYLEKYGARVSHSKLIPSYLLMLSNPSKYIFVKPNLFSKLSSELGVRIFKKHERLSFNNYTAVLRLFDDLSKMIADLKPRDMLDLQSFYYVVLTYKSEKARTIGHGSDEAYLNVDTFISDASNVGFVVDGINALSLACSLQAKPFMLLTGLSGSGKTQLAMAFAKWICVGAAQYELIAVGADWTSNENLLGYPDALNQGHYRKPDHGALDLVLRAGKDPDNPYFLILDEMNLSHVERYFADFLSAMESGEAVSLHDGGKGDLWNDVPGKLRVPQNLFVIGTVNVDETTYMFSPKVLDRANVIEFRVSANEMSSFLENPVKPDLDALSGKGAQYAKAFVAAATDKNVALDEALRETVAAELMRFFPALEEAGAEFGYRTAHEICRYVHFFMQLSGEDEGEAGGERGDAAVASTAMDSAIMQKLLPKLHGSKKKLGPVLETLAGLCPEEKHTMSAAKIKRMQKRLVEHGFTSFAEA